MKLRTLLFHPCDTKLSFFSPSIEKISINSLDMLLTHPKMLHTLYLPNLRTDHVPDSIGELTHLRYLNLSCNQKLKHLPKSFCKLLHLMFLDLRGCSLLDKLPEKIEKLVNLRQLYIQGCSKLDFVPLGLKALTLLVKLDRLIVHSRNGGLGYLTGLDNLCGSLEIELPQEGWPDAIEDAKKANMLKKHTINEIVIKWVENDTSATREHLFGKEKARAVMEALEPVESLECLDIRKYKGEMLWSWFWTLKNMRELHLSECDHVEYLADGITSNVCFPFLKTFKIGGMKNLKGWWRQEIDEEARRLCFPLVSSLSIRGCPELKGQMPVMQGLEDLCLEGVDVKMVEQLLHVNSNFSSLSTFNLSDIKGLICLHEGCIQHLTALQKFMILRCKDLRWVSSRGLAHLTTLKSLIISTNAEIGDADEDEKMGNGGGMPWKALQELEDLHLVVGNKQLLEGLRYLTRLLDLEVDKWLDIEEEDGVEVQLKGLHNLRGLRIGFDGKTVVHFPTDGIQDLHSSSTLSISYCKGIYWSWKAILSLKLDTLRLNGVERVMDVEDGKMTAMEDQSRLQTLQIYGGAAENFVYDDIPWNFLSLLRSLELFGMEERDPTSHLLERTNY